jgi:APA family basic amino acid/polyamine antiporter
MNTTADPPLRRVISGPFMVLFGLGTIIGAGIYVLIGEVAGQAGSWTPISFVLAALVAAFTGLSYSELVARIPRSAGEALYVRRAFGWSWLTVLVGWAVVFTGLVSAATLVRGLAGYGTDLLASPLWVWIVGAAILVSAVAIAGVKQSVGLAVAITLIEIFGLVLIVAATFGEWTDEENWQTWSEGLAHASGLGIAAGAFLAFYSFIGFEDMVNMAEEVRSSARALPRAILAAIAVATVIYLIVALVAVVSVSPAWLAESQSPLTLLAEGTPWLPPQVIGVISLLAILNGVVVQFLMGPRVMYGMSRAGNGPSWLGVVWRRTQTPVPATLLFGGLLLVFALALPVARLAQITAAVILMVFILVNLALILIRRREPFTGFKVPRAIPYIGAVSCTLLLVAQVGLDLTS